MAFASEKELKDFLDTRVDYYNKTDFIQHDPISIPACFTKKEDIEIAGFLTALISWGQRKTIIKNANRLMDWMDQAPYDFIINHQEKDLKRFEYFVHRTRNAGDMMYMINRLKIIYSKYGGLEAIFTRYARNENTLEKAIVFFHQIFFDALHLPRTRKHLPDIKKGSAAKRLNMFLRWMVRNDQRGVDFGIWKRIPAASLFLPLDVHSGNVARVIGLTSRKQNDWKTVVEITGQLKKMDPEDPVKYDFALFGLGVFEHYGKG